MYTVVLSAAAQRTADALSDSRYAEFVEICSYLSEFLPALQAAGLVTRARLWGVNGYRYFDRRFPYLLFFEVAEMSRNYREDVVLVHLILPTAAS